jgi:hypothetical protein
LPLSRLFSVRPSPSLTLAATLPATTAVAAEICWQAWWYADASALRLTLFLFCAVLLAHLPHCPLAPAPNTRVPRTAPLAYPPIAAAPSQHAFCVVPLNIPYLSAWFTTIGAAASHHFLNCPPPPPPPRAPPHPHPPTPHPLPPSALWPLRSRRRTHGQVALVRQAVSGCRRRLPRLRDKLRQHTNSLPGLQLGAGPG